MGRKRAELIVKAPDLRDFLRLGTERAEAVRDNWSSGNLAEAVNELEPWISEAKQLL